MFGPMSGIGTWTVLDAGPGGRQTQRLSQQARHDPDRVRRRREQRCGCAYPGRVPQEDHRTARPGGEQSGGRGPGHVDRLQEQRQARRLYAGADQRPAAADRRLRPGTQVPLHHERLSARRKSRTGPGRHPGQKREPLQNAGGPAQRREGTAGPGEAPPPRGSGATTTWRFWTSSARRKSSSTSSI